MSAALMQQLKRDLKNKNQLLCFNKEINQPYKAQGKFSLTYFKQKFSETKTQKYIKMNIIVKMY